MAVERQRGESSRGRTTGRPDVRFHLGLHDGVWRVERLVVHVAGDNVQDRIRGRDWPANAAMDALAAALACLKLKATQSQPAVLRAESAEERSLALRCATLWRNVNAGTAKWASAVFEGLPGADAAKDGILRSLIRVRGTKNALIVELAPGRNPDEFSFFRGAEKLSDKLLGQFVEAVGRVNAPTAVEAPPAMRYPEESPAATAQDRVQRENIHRRPVLAISSGMPDESPVPHRWRFLRMVIDDVARLLAECQWHVVHGPRGAGITAVSAAILQYKATSLTHTLVIGPAEQLLSAADVVLVLGSGTDVHFEAMSAIAMRKRVIPIVQTGRAARRALEGALVPPRLSADCLKVLVESNVRRDVCTALYDALRELAYRLTPPERRPSAVTFQWGSWEES